VPGVINPLTHPHLTPNERSNPPLHVHASLRFSAIGSHERDLALSRRPASVRSTRRASRGGCCDESTESDLAPIRLAPDKANLLLAFRVIRVRRSHFFHGSRCLPMIIQRFCLSRRAKRVKTRRAINSGNNSYGRVRARGEPLLGRMRCARPPVILAMKTL